MGLVIVIGVITIGVVALNNRNQSTAPVPLPPMATLAVKFQIPSFIRAFIALLAWGG